MTERLPSAQHLVAVWGRAVEQLWGIGTAAMTAPTEALYDEPPAPMHVNQEEFTVLPDPAEDVELVVEGKPTHVTANLDPQLELPASRVELEPTVVPAHASQEPVRVLMRLHVGTERVDGDQYRVTVVGKKPDGTRAAINPVDGGDPERAIVTILVAG